MTINKTHCRVCLCFAIRLRARAHANPLSPPLTSNPLPPPHLPFHPASSLPPCCRPSALGGERQLCCLCHHPSACPLTGLFEFLSDKHRCRLLPALSTSRGESWSLLPEYTFLLIIRRLRDALDRRGWAGQGSSLTSLRMCFA